MNPAAKELVRAVLTRLRDVGANAGKTKLLKLLYLADIEHFRKTGVTLTGFDWIFFLYGPWAPEFDDVLTQLETEAIIGSRDWAATGVEGRELYIKDPLDIGKVIADTDEYFRTKGLIDTFAALSTPELLDYVYFSTEPMQAATKMERLDFGKVSKVAPRLYRRSASGTPAKRVQELRTRFKKVHEEIEEQARAAISQFWTPTLDDHYIRALEVLNSEGEE